MQECLMTGVEIQDRPHPTPMTHVEEETQAGVEMISEHPVPIVVQPHEPLPAILWGPDKQQACVPDGTVDQPIDILVVREEVIVE